MDFCDDCWFLSVSIHFLGLDWFLFQLSSFSAKVLVLMCDLLGLPSAD